MKYLIKNINEFSDSELNNFKDKINDQKRKRLNKMNKKAQYESIVGEILLSILLKEENIDYEKIIIQYNENGKPYISNYPIHYNISHNKDFVICAIHNMPIGVDILKMNDIKKEFAKSFCNDSEYNYINSKYQFYQIFTLKEAYIKLLGKKINDIKTINIIYNNQIKLDVLYKTILVKNNYLVSICYQNN